MEYSPGAAFPGLRVEAFKGSAAREALRRTRGVAARL